MKLLIIGAVLILSVFAKNCENPLFQSRVFQELGVTMPKLRVAPSTQVSEEFCAELKDQSSCCSNAALITMKKTFEQYESSLKLSVEKVLEKAVAHCDELDNLKSNSKVAARFENTRAQILESMAEEADKCQTAALAHTRGLLCMACAADSQEFINENTILLDGSNLDELNDACNAFIQSAVKFEKTVESHTASLRKSVCKKVALKLTNTAANSVNLCVQDETAAFHQYVNSVAKFIAAKYEFAAGYKFHYKAGSVFVCDGEGCEEEKISDDAHAQFKNVITGTAKKAARQVTQECNIDCVEARLRNAANGLFFNFDALLVNEKTTTEVVTFVEEGYKFRQAATTNTTTTTTTTSTNTTAKVNSTDASAINAMADALKTKLSNSTAQVDVYFGSATAMKVLLVPLALLGLVMLN